MVKNRDMPNNTPSQEDFPLSGYKGLVIAIFKLMMKDLTISESEIEIRPHDSKGAIKWKKKKKSDKCSAYCFVMSKWFEDLCWYIGVEPDIIRRYAIERYNESKKK